MNIITVPSDKKDALIYADLLYREAVAAAAAKALAPAAEAPGWGKEEDWQDLSHPLRQAHLFGVLCYRRGRARELHGQAQEIQSYATRDKEGVRHGGWHGGLSP